MQKNGDDSIRKKFGEAIKKYRNNQHRRISQTQLCIKFNSIINQPGLELYQKKLSRIERGEFPLALSNKTVITLAEICNISEDIYQPYLALMKSDSDSRDDVGNLVCIKEFEYLLTNPMAHSDFSSYLGEYFCYFYSTNSSEGKIVEGRMTVFYDSKSSICKVKFVVYKNDKEIKWYNGQFLLNSHYRKAYIILIGEKKQEVCFLIINHFNSTINSNQLNMALALTTAAGSKKRATTHRMLISRKRLSLETLHLVLSELKLNNDKIMISEYKLVELKNELKNKISDNNKNIYYMDTIKCINYILDHCSKETVYTIDESIIYDSSEITDNKSISAHIVAMLRGLTDTKYNNKISETVEEICLHLVEDD